MKGSQKRSENSTLMILSFSTVDACEASFHFILFYIIIDLHFHVFFYYYIFWVQYAVIEKIQPQSHRFSKAFLLQKKFSFYFHFYWKKGNKNRNPFEDDLTIINSFWLHWMNQSCEEMEWLRRNWMRVMFNIQIWKAKWLNSAFGEML